MTERITSLPAQLDEQHAKFDAQSSVSSSGQKINRGDLLVTPGKSGFTSRQCSVFADLKKQGQITAYTTRLQTGAQIRKRGNNANNVLGEIIGYLSVLYTGLFSGIKTVVYGAIAGIGALVLAGLLTQVFVSLVWLISKLPSMGRISVRMALRNMGTQKRRLGSALLALCIGMLVLSTVTILSQNLEATGQATLHRLNTNVFVQSTQDPSMVRRVDRETARIPGVSHRDIGAEDSALTLSSVNGTNLNALLRRALKGDARGKHKFDKSSVSDRPWRTSATCSAWASRLRTPGTARPCPS